MPARVIPGGAERPQPGSNTRNLFAVLVEKPTDSKAWPVLCHRG
jgi:hypothetical protein